MTLVIDADGTFWDVDTFAPWTLKDAQECILGGAQNGLELLAQAGLDEPAARAYRVVVSEACPMAHKRVAGDGPS